MVNTLRSALHSLVSGLVRRTWFLALVTVIVCSAFAAKAVAALVEADYLAPTTHGVSPQPREARSSVPTRTSPDGTGLVARNMFCSTCGPVPGGDPGPTGATYSGKPAVLIATGIGSDPWATVRVIESEVQGSWSLGETIPGVGKILRIGGISIDVVDGAGHVAKLSLLETAVAGGPVVGAATPTTAPDDPYASRIKKLDDHTYEVDRELVRELVAAASKPGKMRLSPILKDGEIQGVRVFGVSAGTPAFAIGMKNGDTINAIGGDPIKTANQLLDLYSKLDKLDGVELQGLRGGKPLVIDLRFR